MGHFEKSRTKTYEAQFLCGQPRSARERPRRPTPEQRDDLAPFHRPVLPCFRTIGIHTDGRLLHCGISIQSMSQLGHSRPEQVGRRSRHVRYAPKATVRHRNAVCREGPKAPVSGCSKLRAYSITSSARSRTEVGKSIPIVFAVLRLRINSNLVGCSIGRSVVLVPRAILST